MQHDTTTLKDLSILGGTHSVFQLLDFCTTQKGKEVLRKMILHPPSNYESLQQEQEVIRYFAEGKATLPTIISNGTLVMLEKFFESADHIPQKPSGFNLLFNAYFQKALNRNEYSFHQFSVSHLADFFKGCKELTLLLASQILPEKLRNHVQEIQRELEQSKLTEALLKVKKEMGYQEMATISYEARRELKNPIERLLKRYSQLDAWQSIGKAAVTHHWSFPKLQPSIPVVYEASGLYHPLLQQPKAYDIHFNEQENFLLLTGANMSGKTTYMRSLGIGALLAHIGSAVPAQAMTISFLQGIITNMHVEDNIHLGESLFMAEVQRIKQTAQKVISPHPHLVLMDELFKGTNVHDAFECTKAVVSGLLAHPHHIMVLSTHLYEVAQQFRGTASIQFHYFETQLTTSGPFSFTYELKKGISNDRIGYRILEKEGVLNLLKGKSE